MANRTAVIQTNKGTIKFELLKRTHPKLLKFFACSRKRVITTHYFSSRYQRLHASRRRIRRARDAGASQPGGKFDENQSFIRSLQCAATKRNGGDG